MATAKKTTTPKAATATTTKPKQQGFFENFNREDNMHMFVGIVFLVIGLWQLKQLVLGGVFLIIGILFVTGYFEKNKRK